MSNDQWKKRYTFRLTENEMDVYLFLEKVPNNKRSETIRQMLKYALRHMEGKQKENKQLQELLSEIHEIKKQLENNHLELMKKLKSGSFTIEENKDEEISEAEKTISASVDAFLDSFGGFDDF